MTMGCAIDMEEVMDWSCECATSLEISENSKARNTTANLLHAHGIGASPDGLVFHHSPSTGGALHPGRLLAAALQTVDLLSV
jgi:hypothetical protein